MKYKTFRNLFVGTAASVVILGVVAIRKVVRQRPAPPPAPVERAEPAPRPQQLRPTTELAPAVAPAQTITPTRPPTSKDRQPLRPMDREILERALGLADGKIKDLFRDRPYKVNVIKGPGDELRLKVDLNRNGKWDEKWLLGQKNGQTTVKRQVAPADDEDYSDSYRLQDQAWVQK